MIYVVAAVVLGAAIGVPHALRLDGAPPALAAGVWLCALLLRAVASLLAAVLLELYVPVLHAYAPLAGVCLRAGPLGFSGHAAGDAVLALPTFVLIGSLVAVLVGIWRAARRVRRLLRESVVGPGPAESLILADAELLVAAAGIWRPQVLISAGALLTLDDEELAASLAHERGHIARHHRYVIVLGELARAVGRFLPGSRAAARELLFHLERDADRFALAQRHSPAVLASAICKAAQHEQPIAPTLALGGGVVTRRARQLLESPQLRRPGLGLLVLAPAMIVLLTLSAGALPFVAHDTIHRAHAEQASIRCRA